MFSKRQCFIVLLKIENWTQDVSYLKSLECLEDSWNLLLKGFEFLILRKQVPLSSRTKCVSSKFFSDGETKPLVLFNVVVSFEAQKIYSSPVWEQQLIFKMLPFPKASPSWKTKHISHQAPYGVCEEWTRGCFLIKALKFVMRNGGGRWLRLGACLGGGGWDWIPARGWRGRLTPSSANAPSDWSSGSG